MCSASLLGDAKEGQTNLAFFNRLLKKSFPGLFHLSSFSQWGATPTRVKSSIFMLDLRAIHPWMAYQAAFSAAW